MHNVIDDKQDFWCKLINNLTYEFANLTVQILCFLVKKS